MLSDFFSRAVFILLAGAAQACLLTSGVVAAPPRQKPPIAEFDVGADGDFLLLPVTIDQHEYPFLLSTGLPTTMIDETLRKKFDLRKLEEPTGTQRGSSRRDRYGGLRAALGNIRLEFPEGVEAGDYTAMREGLDGEFFGEMGMDILASYIMQIDFDKGKLRLLASLPPGPGEAVRIRQTGDEGRVPIVQLVLAGQPAQRFFISTARGGNSLDVKPDLLAKLEEQGHATNLSNERGIQRSGTRRFDAYRLDTARLGATTVEGLICNVSEQNGLGLSFLSRFVVTFDFPRGKMYLRKGAHFGEPDGQLDLEEVAVARARDGVTLREVHPYGPAGRLGLRRGDLVRTINGHDVQRMSNWQVRRVLGQSDRALTAVIRRDDEELTLHREPGRRPGSAASGDDADDE